ncbi:19547_t:CDS:2 [Entrophospora sp. SA101]|nr:19547_t:CDS:2 [Entrophospora sp. SA101]
MSAKENWHSEISITAFLNSEYGSYGIPMEIMAYLWKLWHVCGDYGTESGTENCTTLSHAE